MQTSRINISSFIGLELKYIRLAAFLFPIYLYMYEDLILCTSLFVFGFLVAMYEGIDAKLNELDMRDFIFFTYMFHMLIGEREFAYVGFEPLFITEITLFILGVLYIQKLIKVRKLLLPYYLLVVIGLFFGLIYFPKYRISALRDSLMLVYAIWVPIIYNVFNSKKKYSLFFELLKVFIAIKVAHYLYRVGLILLGLWFPTFEGFRFGVGYALPSLIVVMLVLPLKKFDPKYKILSLVMIMAVFTLFHRSLFLGIMLAIAIYFVLGSWTTQKTLMKYGIAGLAGLSLFLLIYVSVIDFNFWAYLSNKTSLQEGNISFRFITWGKAFEKFQENFLLGYGVGRPIYFVLGTEFYDTIDVSYFEIRDLGGNAQPHNSYLNILARFGILVFPIFLWSLIKPFTKIKQMWPIKKFSIPIYNRYLLLLGFVIIMYVFAFFNVVLEGPHHAFAFWLAIALALGYRKYALVYPRVKLARVD